MINTVINFFKRPQAETQNEVPEGLCPNCWGEQEYDKQIRELYKDKQIDINHYEANYAFIQDFMVTHLNGIHLIKGNNGMECPTCKARYNS
ncbi:MAG: hypothetical protein DRI54_09185 [Bacteroidetes bacterium]|nr:MAG: hypothetical protein DRI54_09185 [Bacteroidota bacterium]